MAVKQDEAPIRHHIRCVQSHAVQTYSQEPITSNIPTRVESLLNKPSATSSPIGLGLYFVNCMTMTSAECLLVVTGTHRGSASVTGGQRRLSQDTPTSPPTGCSSQAPLPAPHPFSNGECSLLRPQSSDRFSFWPRLTPL